MPTTDQVIQQTEKRLAEVEALQATMQQAQQDLSAYGEQLRQKLALLRDGEAPPQAAAEGVLMAENVVEESGFAIEDAELAATEAQAAERRGAPRRRGNPVSVQVSNAVANVEPWQGWVVDRSSGGLCLLVDQQVKAGTIISVRPTKCHSGFPWIQVRVKSCRPERNSWNLGCQFEHKLSWSEMQVFG